MKRRTLVRKSNARQRAAKRKAWINSRTGLRGSESKKKPKNSPLTQKQRAAKLLGVSPKSITTTGKQRRELHAGMEERLGYKIPKLSDVVGKPSRHRVKERVVVYRTEPVFETRRTYVPRNRVYETRKVKVGERKVPIGEKLVVKRDRRSRKGSG